MTRPVRLALALILLLSAIVQWTTVRETVVIGPARADAAAYVSYAYNLRESGIYSRTNTWLENAHPAPHADSVSPPGYPLFLSAFMKGKPDLAFMKRVIDAQAAIGVLTTLFAFLLAARALPAGLACGAALLTAMSPHLAIVSSYLLTEALFTCLLLAALWACLRALQIGRARDWAFAGCVFGLCCLVRPTLQLVPVFVLLAAISPRLKAYRRSLATAAVCWALVMGPWLAFKYTVDDSAHPNEFRATLYHGSFPGFMYDDRPETYGFAYQYDPAVAQAMGSYRGLETVVGDRIREQPLRYLRWYLLGKPAYFLSWGIVAGMGDIYIYPVATSPFLARPAFQAIRATMFVLHWPLILLGLAAAIVALWRPGWLRLPAGRIAAIRTIAALLLLAIVFHMIGAPYPRYGIPFRPLFYLLAMAMAHALWRAVARKADAQRHMAGGM